jgi:hypothetical protein
MCDKSLSGIDDGYGGKSLIMYDATIISNNINNQTDVASYLQSLQQATTIQIPGTSNNTLNSVNANNFNSDSITANGLNINGLSFLNSGFISTTGTLSTSLTVTNITITTDTINSTNNVNINGNNINLIANNGQIDLSSNILDISANIINETASGLLNLTSNYNNITFTSGTNGLILTTSGILYPKIDATHNLGSSTNRYNTIYATTGTINTSDLKMKKDITKLDLGLKFVNKMKPVKYKYIDTDDKIRFGFIAQDVKKIIKEYYPNDDVAVYKDDEIMGLNYTELIAPLYNSINELIEIINKSKEEIDELKNVIKNFK